MKKPLNTLPRPLRSILTIMSSFPIDQDPMLTMVNIQKHSKMQRPVYSKIYFDLELSLIGPEDTSGKELLCIILINMIRLLIPIKKD